MSSELERRPPYQQRVIAEKAELDSKLRSLEAFIFGPYAKGLDEDEQRRLSRQRAIMVEYSCVLEERIEHFAAPPPA